MHSSSSLSKLMKTLSPTDCLNWDRFSVSAVKSFVGYYPMGNLVVQTATLALPTGYCIKVASELNLSPMNFDEAAWWWGLEGSFVRRLLSLVWGCCRDFFDMHSNAHQKNQVQIIRFKWPLERWRALKFNLKGSVASRFIINLILVRAAPVRLSHSMRLIEAHLFGWTVLLFHCLTMNRKLLEVGRLYRDLNNWCCFFKLNQSERFPEQTSKSSH